MTKGIVGNEAAENTTTQTLRDMPISATDAMNDALEQGSRFGFEMKPGFSTHWSMGSEALIALGHPELVHKWVARFIDRQQHYERPVRVGPIDPGDEADWRGALGDYQRVSDWYDLFERELAEQPWTALIEIWWPRLVFGCSAGLTHGLIRTMHAVRSIDRGGQMTELQQRELATALAYWAARYVEQPSSRTLGGEARLPEIVARIPRIDPDDRIGLRDKGLFLHMPSIAGWGETVAQLATPEDVESAFSELTLAFVQVQLVHPDLFPIPLVHTTTAPAAMRTMLGYLPERLHAPSFVAVWHACAALLSSFAQAQPEEIAPAFDSEVAVLSPAELTAQAVEHGEMHAIKLTEACLREYAIHPDPRYLQLPYRLMSQLPPFFRREARTTGVN